MSNLQPTLSSRIFWIIIAGFGAILAVLVIVAILDLAESIAAAACTGVTTLASSGILARLGIQRAEAYSPFSASPGYTPPAPGTPQWNNIVSQSQEGKVGP